MTEICPICKQDFNPKRSKTKYTVTCSVSCGVIYGHKKDSLQVSKRLHNQIQESFVGVGYSDLMI